MVGKFWDGMLRSVRGLDILYFQDGIGVHKLSLEKLPQYYGALRIATDRHKRQMRPVIELFEQTGGQPIAAGAFAAVPAPVARVARQIEIANRYAGMITIFSVPEYMAPGGGAAAAEAFTAYAASQTADCRPGAPTLQDGQARRTSTQQNVSFGNYRP